MSQPVEPVAPETQEEPSATVRKKRAFSPFSVVFGVIAGAIIAGLGVWLSFLSYNFQENIVLSNVDRIDSMITEAAGNPLHPEKKGTPWHPDPTKEAFLNDPVFQTTEWKEYSAQIVEEKTKAYKDWAANMRKDNSLWNDFELKEREMADKLEVNAEMLAIYEHEEELVMQAAMACEVSGGVEEAGRKIQDRKWPIAGFIIKGIDYENAYQIASEQMPPVLAASGKYYCP